MRGNLTPRLGGATEARSLPRHKIFIALFTYSLLVILTEEKLLPSQGENKLF